MEARLDPIFQAAIDSKRVAGVSAVVLDGRGEALFSKGYGHVTAGDSSSAKVDPTTPGVIWSCTKLITSIAALQLVEQGKLSLDDPAKKYVPDIKSIKLLEGFNDDGSPKLRDSEGTITLLHLITHTSGMSYDFFNASETLKYRIYHKLPLVPYMDSPKNAYYNVLLFEPGKRYEYGVNIDWLGFVVEKVSGMTLDDYIKKYIAAPLGLEEIGSQFPPDRGRPYMTVHVKTDDGVLTPTPMRVNPNAEVPHAGGGYLYGSTMDYSQVLLALVNGGTHPSGATILKPETVRDYIFTDMLPRVGCSKEGVGAVPVDTLPNCSCQGEFMPGVQKGWSCGLLINLEDTPNGRPAGSGGWAGLGNCYYWADPKNKIVGMLMSESLPWFDRDILHLFDAMERAAYGKPAAKEVGEPGSNFSNGVNQNAAQAPAA